MHENTSFSDFSKKKQNKTKTKKKTFRPTYDAAPRNNEFK